MKSSYRPPLKEKMPAEFTALLLTGVRAVRMQAINRVTTVENYSEKIRDS